MQTLLSVEKNPNTGQDIAIRIKYLVQSDISQKGGSTFEHILAKEPSAFKNVDETQVAISLNLLSKLRPGNVCRGIMTYKDLYDEGF